MDMLDDHAGSVHSKNLENFETKPRGLNVYIWDMDETLILLKSLLDGTFADCFNGVKDVKKGKEIGKQWEGFILHVCDRLFFYEQIEHFNGPFLDCLKEYDDGRDLVGYDFNRDGIASPCDDENKRKLAYRHRVIAEQYSQGLRKFYDERYLKLWDDLYNLTDDFTDGWFTSARSLLEQLSRRNESSTSHAMCSEDPDCYSVSGNQNINILVTSGSLVPSIVKCLLFRLDGLISKENVFSSWDVGKLKCFEWIKEKYGGPGVRFCAIGDGLEECFAAEKMGWPFVKIDFQPHSRNRFPGLSMKMLGLYMDVIYEVQKDEDLDDGSS